jgi:ABC-2 type transport system permease protein
MLYLHYARSERRNILGLTFAMLFLLVVSVGTFIAFRDSGALAEFQKVIAQLPKPLQQLFAQEFSLTQVEGWLQLQFFKTEFPLILSAFTAISTVAVVTKEADQGTLSFLLTLPVPRIQVLLQRFAGLLTGLALVNAAVAVAVPVVLLGFGFQPDWGGYGLIGLNAYLTQAAVASVLLLITIFLDEAPIATAVSLVLGIGLFIMTVVLKEEGWQLTLRRLSPFHYYRPSEILKTGALDAGNLILLGIAVAATGLATLAFRRKQVTT